MQLTDWLRAKGRGELARIQRVSGVSYSTLHKVTRGTPVGTYEVARKISDATGGKVTVLALMEVGRD